MSSPASGNVSTATGSGSVKLPGVGKVKSQYVLIGGAAVAGILAVAYFRRGRDTTTPALDPNTTALGDPTLPTVTTTTIPANTDVIATNDAWARKAIELLQGFGYDGAFVATVLGKFLGRRTLTPEEEPVALAALAAVGQPPVGAPYNVLSGPPSGGPAAGQPPKTKLGQPQIHVDAAHVTAGSAPIAWTRVPNATQYRIWHSPGIHVGTISGTTYRLPRRTGVYWITAIGDTTKTLESAPSNHVNIV
jgi:hypothetical protein